MGRCFLSRSGEVRELAEAANVDHRKEPKEFEEELPGSGCAGCAAIDLVCITNNREEAMNSARHSRLPRAVQAGWKACLVAIAIALLLTGAPAAFGQTIFANLSGTVLDPSGAVVPGAKISIQNAETQAVRQAVTNNAGYFSATELPTGAYNVSAEVKGFKRWQGTGIALTSSDSKTLSISLEVGVTSDTIEVSASASEVAVTDSGEKSAVITSQQLERLSLVGRNATEYLKILPGAALSANNGVNRMGY